MKEVIEIVRNIMLRKVKKIEREHIIRFNFVNCPDQFVATITVGSEDIPSVKFDKKVEVKNSENDTKGTAYYYERISVDDYTPDKTENIIIVILESPHNDEYCKEHGEKIPKGPAYGKTGANFNKYFLLLLRNAIIDKKIVLKSGHYEIIFMNGIQYQCSLGDTTSKYRDEFFLNCWDNDKCKEDFKERLKRYVSLGKDCVVINCCTKGKKNLQKMVHDEIQDVCRDVPTYLCTHPCSWFVPDIHS